MNHLYYSSDDELEVGKPDVLQSPSKPRKQSLRKKVKKVGNYVLGETVGKGSFGIVKMGWKEEAEDVKYALKFVSKKEVTDVESVERVFRESAILTSLKCEQIVRLHEVIDEVTHIVMVMEFCSGGELLDYLQENTVLTEREACRIFHEILSGVEYCHRKNVVHRDLKLENILISSNNNNIKIADFGLSNTAITGRSMGTACGTPSYLAPEQIERESNRHVGAPADLWSMGVILYAMTAGFLPFDAKGTPALFKKVLSRDFAFPDYFSEELRDLIDRLLTLDPDHRASLAEIKSHTWYLMEVTDLAQKLTHKVTEGEVQAARDKIRADSRRRRKASSQSKNAGSPAALSPSNSTPTNADTDREAGGTTPSRLRKLKQQSMNSGTTRTPKRLSSRTSSSSALTRTNTKREAGAGQFKMRGRHGRMSSVEQLIASPEAGMTISRNRDSFALPSLRETTVSTAPSTNTVSSRIVSKKLNRETAERIV